MKKQMKGNFLKRLDRLTSKVWIRKLSGKDAAPLALKTIEADKALMCVFVAKLTAGLEEWI